MKRQTYLINLTKLLFLVAIIFASFGAKAASLTISPTTSSVSVGGNISINFEVNSSDKSINAISGSVKYDKSLLKIVSISKASSIIDFWTQEPEYLSNSGSINLEGVILNPGFVGQKGRIVTVVFAGLKEGSVSIKIENANVLANDGAGTSVLSSVGTAKINITKAITLPGAEKPSGTEGETVGAGDVGSGTEKPDEIIPETPKVIEKIEITDYPLEVGQGEEFFVKGEGGEVPIDIFAVKIEKNKLLGNSVTYYRDITNLPFTLESKAVFKDGSFQAKFKVSKDGRYGFYAKDQKGNLSSVVFVEISNDFWIDLKTFLAEKWWIGLILLAFVLSNHIFYRLGKKSEKY